MNYLILLRRADFIDLYKYGFLNVNKEKIVPFDCSISEIESKQDLYDKIFEEVNSFESSFANSCISTGLTLFELPPGNL